jgi:hypothetical protein
MSRIMILFGLVLGTSGLQSQTAQDVNEGLRLESSSTMGVSHLKWFGKPGRTYFVQTSESLMAADWAYAPVVEAGGSAVIQWGYTSTSERAFLRLVYTDISYIGTAASADFDGDGITNLEELNTHHTDPFKADTDNDGLPDGWEVLHGLNPLNSSGSQGGQGDLDGDGMSNQEEHYFGRNPASSAPDALGDIDLDGVPDYRDAVQYDPAFNHSPSGIPRYAFVDLGPCYAFWDMSDNGTLLWQSAAASGGNTPLARWSPVKPTKYDFTISSATKPSGAYSFSPKRIFNDGRLYGIGQETSNLGRIGVFDPDTSLSNWLAPLTPEPGVPLSSFSIDKCALGPGGEIYSGVSYTLNIATGIKDWAAHMRVSGTASVFESKAAKTQGSFTHNNRQTDANSAHGVARYKETTGSNYSLKEYELVTGSSVIPLESAEYYANARIFDFTQVAPMNQPWVIGRRTDYADTTRSGTYIYKPNANASSWQPHALYLNESDFTLGSRLKNYQLVSAQKQVFADHNSSFTGIWADGQFEKWADNNISWNDYSSRSLERISETGVVAAEASIGGQKRMLAMVPVDFGIADESIIVPADVAQVELPTYFEGNEERVLGGRVSWQIVAGTGGTLSQQTAEFGADDVPDVDTMLTTSHVTNQSYQVQANLTEIKMGDPAVPGGAVWLPSSLKTRSGTILVGPGEASNIVMNAQKVFLGPTVTSIPSDGTSTLNITAFVRDEFGNFASSNIPTFWRLKGDGETFQESSVTTNVAGFASLRAGRFPGLTQTVILEIDEKRQELLITNTSLNVGITPGVVQTETSAVGEVKTFTVTATASAANGTAVRWSTSQGVVTAQQNTITSGAASATIKVTLPNEAGGAPVVVIASVAESSAITSVELAPLAAILAATPVVPDETSNLTINAPSLAGREVKVSSSRTHVESALYESAELADGVVSSSPQLTAHEFGVEVAWTRPPAPPAAPAFTGAVLVQNSVYELSVNASGLPTVVLNPGSTPITLAITDSTAAPAPGESVTIYWNFDSGTKMSLSSKGRKVETLLADSPPAGTEHGIPTGSTSLVSAVKLHHRPDTAAPVPATDVRPVKLDTQDDEITLTLPPSGIASVAVNVPDDQITEGSDRLQLRIETVDVAEVGNPPLPQYSFAYSVPIAQPVPGSGPDAGAIAADSATLWTNVEYDNRPATAAEQGELTRYAHAATARAAVTDFQTDLAGLSPPAFGGQLAHQAQQGKNFLAMAQKIDVAITDIEALARRMDQMTVTDGTGKQLFQVDTAIGARTAMLLGRTSLGQWIQAGKQKMAAALKEAGDSALTATVESFQSTMSWTHSTLVAAKLDNLPLIRDADKLVQQLTEEGLVDYMKALSRLTTTIQNNPQASALHLFSQLEGVIQPPLDSWAAGGGDTEKVAVAGAGMLTYCVQTGSLIASTTCDKDAVRRMVGNALGTIISAAVGSTEARNELEELVPFWSWLVMGEQVADFWQTAQYYKSGKRAGELVVQAIGDITILIPVVKGAQIAIKSVNGVTKASIRQALSKVGNTFTRKKQTDPVGASETITHSLDHPAGSIGCFPAGTLVLMGDGSLKAIEAIRAEELIMADDPGDDLPAAPRRVLELLENRTEQLCDVQVLTGTATSTVTSTSEHPFWVQGKGWTAAADLSAGSVLTTPNNKTVTVHGVSLRDTKCGTWNLTVTDSHSFFVKAGECVVLVHNTKPGARVYVVYEVPLPNGKYYVGRCSLPWDGVSSVEEAAQKAIRRRFARHHRAAIHDGFLEKNAKTQWHEIYDASDYSKKQSIYGTMRGVEHRLEEDWANQGKSANRDTPGWKKPIADNNPNRTTYLNKADTRGIQMCPKR